MTMGYADHSDAPIFRAHSDALLRRHITICLSQLDYDDGNGLWINCAETPCDQGLIGKYYPQDYTGTQP